MEEKQESKQKFLARQTEIDERLVYFRDNYDSWIDSIPCEVLHIVLSMLEHFDYYTHRDANTMLQKLHQELLATDYEEDSAIYTYIKKEKGEINSSVDYWSEYRMINRINKSYCIDDINAFPEEYWEHVENIVIIDDCCCSGNSLNTYLKTAKKSFSEKTIYYLVLHALADAESQLKEIEKNFLTLSFRNFQ